MSLTFTMLFSTILLLISIQPTYQLIYSCNPTVTCGCSSNSVSITRIVGGENAAVATWGWAVSISIDSRSLCGGSIISNTWIVTAAHCVNDYTASQIRIYAGSLSRWSGSQSRVVSKLIVHPNYNRNTYVNDIALLKLSTPLNMSDPNVAPICIPAVSSMTLANREWPAPRTSVVAIGWGRISEGGQTSTTLQQVTLSTVDYSSSTCKSVITNVNVQFCARGDGKDTCQGDSGGPLMMFTSNKQWVLVGLTSFGPGCARPDYSGGYTRVAAYENWIKINTNGSYWPVPLSGANVQQTSFYTLLFFVSFVFFF